VERFGVNNWVKRCISMTVEGREPKDRSKNTWGRRSCIISLELRDLIGRVPLIMQNRGLPSGDKC